VKKIVFMLNILLVFCFANTTIINIDKPVNLNQTIYKNTIETPFGFSIDLQGYEQVIWIDNSKKLRSIALSSSTANNTLWLSTYPFGVPLVVKKDIYKESEFLSEITNPTDNVTIVFYDNSTFYVYELSNGYKAYVVTSMHNNDILASIFQNSKFVASFFIDSNDKKIIENILYSLKQINILFPKKDYLKNIKILYDNGNLQRALLYSSIYYLYDIDNRENINFLNKIIDKIVLTMVLIKNDINE
jgi:hypothetical protein